MLLSIIILNYKTKELVKQCIKGIKLANLAFDYEIIVVDNASNDSIGEMLKERFSDVKFIQSPENVGYAAGNNLGLKQSLGEYILILNPDIVVKEGSIEKMIEYIKQNNEIGLVAPKLINPDKTIQHSCFKFPTFWTPVFRRTPLGRLKIFQKKVDEYLMKDWPHDSNKEVDWLLGAALLFSKNSLEIVGPLDERFVLYFEDVDWCRRFWEKNLKVMYFAESEMVHYHQRLSAEDSFFKSIFNNVTRIHIQSWLKYFWKNR